VKTLNKITVALQTLNNSTTALVHNSWT